MPLVRINLSRDASPEVVRVVSDTVYEAMVDAFGNGEMQYAPKE
ncbi:hypothetical protein [Trinickia mobilis]|nr:hypothetical protein [Trinickia mobilis]